MLTGCAKYYYVDPFSNFRDINPANFKRLENPRPVHLIFEFRTNGITDNQKTESAKNQVTDIVKNSGLFSEVSTSAVKNGATLKVVIDANSDPGLLNLYRLYYGFAAIAVKDRYLCLLTYSKDSEALKISAGTGQVNDMGVSSKTKTKLREGWTELHGYNKEGEAIEKMIQYLVNDRLDQLSNNSTFNN